MQALIGSAILGPQVVPNCEPLLVPFPKPLTTMEAAYRLGYMKMEIPLPREMSRQERLRRLGELVGSPGRTDLRELAKDLDYMRQTSLSDVAVVRARRDFRKAAKAYRRFQFKTGIVEVRKLLRARAQDEE